MLKAVAITLLGMFLIVGADYNGSHGLSVWLAIPLTAGYVYMVGLVLKALIQDARRR